MIYYPLSVLFLAGVREILIITTPEDQSGFQRLLGDGSRFGVRFEYVAQPTPGGLAEAYLLGEEFVAGEPSMMILGDNIFFGQNFVQMLRSADARRQGATVFGYPVHDPERYGVVELTADNRALSIEEKPAKPKSNFAVTGLYFYDGRASEMAKTLTRSARGELEITALNELYLQQGELHVELLGRGFAWEDAGTHDSLIQAGELIRTYEQRQGLRIGCLEEIAFQNGWIDRAELTRQADLQAKSEYGRYLRELASQG
jgi:glucose-1-phosphate thymidylyltransferase